MTGTPKSFILKKGKIVVDGVEYVLIKSNDDNGRKQCMHFINYKTNTKICWKHSTTSTEFYYNGKRHREDGPALIITDSKWVQIVGQAWYMNGLQLSREEEQNQIRKINLNKCLD